MFPEGSVPIDDNVSRTLGGKIIGRDRVHIGSAAEVIGEEPHVGVTSRRDRKGVEVLDADDIARSFGQGHQDDGPPNRQPRVFPCLTRHAVTKPPPG